MNEEFNEIIDEELAEYIDSWWADTYCCSPDNLERELI